MEIVPDMVGLVVEDMGRALAFYRQLGLPIPENQDAEPYVEVTVNGYRISFNTAEMVRSFDPEWTAPSGSNRISLAFKCPSAAAVDETFQRMVDSAVARVHKAPWDAFWGQRYAVLLDPDNNTVDIFAPL